jgi:hypothetical protein
MIPCLKILVFMQTPTHTHTQTHTINYQNYTSISGLSVSWKIAHYIQLSTDASEYPVVSSLEPHLALFISKKASKIIPLLDKQLKFSLSALLIKIFFQHSYTFPILFP